MIKVAKVVRLRQTEPAIQVAIRELDARLTAELDSRTDATADALTSAVADATLHADGMESRLAALEAHPPPVYRRVWRWLITWEGWS
jgi:hypothetical protein